MAITTADTLVAASVVPLAVAPLGKSSLTTVAGRLQSMWAASGGLTGAGVAPAAAAIPTKTTAGALCNFPNLSGANVGYADLSGASNSIASTQVSFYDRLAHMGGLSGIVATAQTVAAGPPTRGDVAAYTNVVAFLEVYVSLGITGTTATISYTNGAGTAGRSSVVTIPTNTAAGNLLMFPLQAGDLGVKSVETVTLGVSTGTAGNFGISLARLIGTVNVPVAGAQAPSPISTMGVVPENACLWAVVTPPSNVSGIVQGSIKLIQG